MLQIILILHNIKGPTRDCKLSTKNRFIDSDIHHNTNKIFSTNASNVLSHWLSIIDKICLSRSYLSLELEHNKSLSNVRLISENYCCAFKMYLSIFYNKWKFKLNTSGLHCRSFVITTNVIITKQNPLTSEFDIE